MAEQANEVVDPVEVQRLLDEGAEGEPDAPQPAEPPVVEHPDAPEPESRFTGFTDKPAPESEARVYAAGPMPIAQARMAVSTALLTASSFLAQIGDLADRLEPLSRPRSAVEAARGKIGEAYNLLAAAAGLLKT